MLMNYRRIEINNSNIDGESNALLNQIAKWHNLTPKIWIPDYEVSISDIEETVQRILNTKNEDLFLTIAEDEEENIQGFIWAYKQDEPQDTVMILSLYVEESHRGYGIATKLKILLEEWCKHNGIKAIQTTVHYKNIDMLELNKKLGYVPGMINMTKTLG
mgnify:FL=1